VVVHEEDYATIEEVGYKRSGNRLFGSKKEPSPSEEKPLTKQTEEPVYAKVKKQTGARPT
jgi:hypothetical protein